MRRRILLGAVLGSAIAVLFTACTPDPSPMVSPQLPKLNLTSTAFASDALIPAKYTCDGKDLSPALAWEAPPTATKSLVIIADDPDAPGKTFTHWVLYDLPPKTRKLPEGLPPQPFLATGGGHGKNDFGKYGYGGPCPPSGTHRYVFKIFALDQMLDLPAGATKAEVLAGMEGHILAAGEWVGKYRRQK
jgi:Raf kinase inhibitor-like YbhB/YbcL family protein